MLQSDRYTIDSLLGEGGATVVYSKLAGEALEKARSLCPPPCIEPAQAIELATQELAQ